MSYRDDIVIPFIDHVIVICFLNFWLDTDCPYIGQYNLLWQYSNENLSYIQILPRKKMIKKNSPTDVENEICLENDNFAFWKTYVLSKSI